ncbi:MAG: DciA family protein [Micropepsaceae bacterium]
MANENPSREAKFIRKRGPEPLGKSALALLQAHLQKRGFAQIEIVTRWPEIAGQGLSAHCVPQKLASSASGGSTLTLLADDRAAIELQHQTPKLIDKINRYFGKPVVSKIKVIAGELPRQASPPVIRRLTAAEEADLAQWTARIEDPALRDALTRLGRNALGESRKSAILKR